MHRIDGPSATTDHKFTEGSPSGGIPATVVSDDWLNDVQENICKVIEGASIALEKGNPNQLLLAIQAIIASSTPGGGGGGGEPGQMSFFARSAPPSGWLKCNGAAVSRTTYAALFAAIGITFGSGDGTTTFNVPDTRGEFLRVLDDGRGVDAGRTIGSYVASLLASHTHTGSAVAAGTHVHPLMGEDVGGPGRQDLTGLSTVADASGRGTISAYGNTDGGGLHTHTLSINASGGAETRPRSVAFPVYIKY